MSEMFLFANKQPFLMTLVNFDWLLATASANFKMRANLHDHEWTRRKFLSRKKIMIATQVRRQNNSGFATANVAIHVLKRNLFPGNSTL